MGRYLGIVMITQRGVGFQGTVYKFPAIGGADAISAFLCLTGGSLALHLPQGSGSVHG